MHIRLPGPLYAAKEVLNRKERQQYRYTIQGGDLEASDKEEEEEEEENDTATESESGAEEEATPEVSCEDRLKVQSHQANQAGEQPTGSGQDEQPDNRAGSAGEEQEAHQGQSPAHSAPTEPAGGQEAQGVSSVDPHVDLEIRQWQGLQAQGLQVTSGFRADMTLVEQTGLLAFQADQVHQEMDFRNNDFKKMAKFLNCAPTPCLITSRICRMVEESKSLTDQIQELEEKKANLDKEHREAQDELVYRRREMVALTKKGEKLREERDGLHNQNRRQHFEKIQLEKELKAATNALTLEEGIRKELQVATEAS